MPSFAYTPGTLVLAGGEINPEPVRFSFTPGSLSLAGLNLIIGPTASASIESLLSEVLDELFMSERIVNDQGQPTGRFHEIWRKTIGNLKTALASQGQSIAELTAIYAGINAAQATASTAAQQAQATESKVSLANSRTEPVSGNLTASSAGNITIAAHNRIYGDGTSVAVNGGSLSGFSPSQFVRVYYSDPAREGGAVTYQGTTAEVVTEGSTHVVGGVAIPEPGQVDTEGYPPFPPGYVPGPRTDIP